MQKTYVIATHHPFLADGGLSDSVPYDLLLHEDFAHEDGSGGFFLGRHKSYLIPISHKRGSLGLNDRAYNS